MSTTPTVPPRVPTALESFEPNSGNGSPSRFAFIESLLDNLSAWTVVAAAVGLLYLVWATLEILSRYVGHLPKVTP